MVDVALGYKGAILGIGEETAWGTAVTPTKFIDIVSESLDVDEERIESAGINAAWRDEDEVNQGGIMPAGDLEFECRYEGWELILKHAMGSVSSAEDSTFTVTLSTNDKIDFKEDAGAELNATVAAGSYAMGTTSDTAGTLCAAIKTALEAAGAGTYTVTFSNTTKKITIAVSGAKSAVQFLWKTGTNGSDNTDIHIGTLIGFDDTADGSSVASDVGDNAVVTVFTHTFKHTEELPIGLTIEVDRDKSAFTIEGGMINTFSLSCEPNGLLMGTIGIIGEDMTAGSATSPTLSTSSLVTFNQCACTYGGSAQVVETFEINLDNKLINDRFSLASRLTRQPTRNDKYDVTGMFKIDFESTAKYNDFRNMTSKVVVFTFTGSEIKSGSSYTLAITFNQLKLTKAVPKINDAGPITVDCEFQARAASAASREMIITLKNTIASI